MPNRFNYILYLIKNNYGQLVYRELNSSMKNDCGLVIIGFAAMQGYSYFKSKGSGKSRRDPKLW